MSFPIQGAAASVGALALGSHAIGAVAQIAKQAGQQLGKAISFDEVLGAGTDPASAEDPVSAEDPIGELTAAIRDRLSSMGMTSNLPDEIRVQSDGQILVGDHPNAAEIEAALAADPEITGLIDQLKSTSSPGPWSIDLTNSPTQGNIPPVPGGYANWLAD
ncbi:hypothetical protein [Rubripirellula lacrimiformis]|uniref:hypothetical protein n=1 Tax=Rubripirellula lacrimiformis TaxID=1930273 RepID=UPI0011A71FDC|nr:hypothetical protein [Rubripirellula lacrimiformis]